MNHCMAYADSITNESIYVREEEEMTKKLQICTVLPAETTMRIECDLFIDQEMKRFFFPAKQIE